MKRLGALTSMLLVGALALVFFTPPGPLTVTSSAAGASSSARISTLLVPSDWMYGPMLPLS